MLVMESLPFIRRHSRAPAKLLPWEERRALAREVSWQERMLKVGASEVDRERAADALKSLRPKLLAAENRSSVLTRNLWAALGAATAGSLVLNGRAIISLVLR
jgi:hypothetical protein